MNGVHQEHGTVSIDDKAWFDRLPVGSLVRVLPNHACITSAAYEAFDVVQGETVVGALSARQRLVTRSQIRRRTLIVPSVGSGEGGGDRVRRLPSSVTLRRCSVPVKLWFQEMSQ